DHAKRLIAEVSKTNAKATHNCYAYLLGDDDHIQRESDNGEPSGTAGVPILEALKMNQIHNVLSVVTRYFGGIKLGAGGLIRAYSNATSSTIDSVGIVKLVLKRELTITIDYNQFDSLKYYLNTNEVPIERTDYGAQVQVTVPVAENGLKEFQEEVINLLSGSVTFKIGNDKIFEEPFSRDKREKTEHKK
ncbi:IMPACT family protein, partial [Lentilactobacillus hilgardii]